MGHATAARFDRFVDGPLLLGARQGLAGGDARDPRRSLIVDRIHHFREVARVRSVGWEEKKIL
jgi:hypothetical protein